MSHEEEISDSEKVRIVSDFILHAPPGKITSSKVRRIINFSQFQENSMKFLMMFEYCWKMTIYSKKKLAQHSHSIIRIN